MKVSKKLIAAVEGTLEFDKTYDEQNINKQLDVIKPGPQQRTRILDACAIVAYHMQTDYPVVSCLLSDDAPQFKLLIEEQALCWIHDGRHYKKLGSAAM